MTDLTFELIDRCAQRLVSWEDGSVWPDSWAPEQVRQARRDAEKVLREAFAALAGAEPVACSHEGYEVPKGGRRCPDCREWITHAPAKAREDGLSWVQSQLPRRVESSAFGDLSAEELSIFDNGYNAALIRAHNLLTKAIDGGSNG